MKFSDTTSVVLSLRGAAAGVLALTLAACGVDSAPPPKVSAKEASPPARPAPGPQAGAEPRESPAPQTAANSALAARVKSALEAERLLRAHGIDVDARDGVVTLFGTVESRMKIEMATAVASTVDGVKSVVNKLVVVAGS